MTAACTAGKHLSVAASSSTQRRHRQYQAGEQAVAHYIMLVSSLPAPKYVGRREAVMEQGCFNVIAIALLVFFFVHRNEQPFKFRDFRVVRTCAHYG
jgi:hypothetical protein